MTSWLPRAVKVILASEGNGTKISAWFNNYNMDDIKAVKADIQFVNIYGDEITLTGVDFVFDKTNLSLLKADYVDCKLPDKYIKIISSSKVYIQKYVTARGVYSCGDDPIDVNMSEIKYKALKLKKGLTLYVIINRTDLFGHVTADMSMREAQKNV